MIYRYIHTFFLLVDPLRVIAAITKPLYFPLSYDIYHVHCQKSILSLCF